MDFAFEVLAEHGVAPSMIQIARQGFRKSGEILAPLAALLTLVNGIRGECAQNDIMPTQRRAGEVPSYTLDTYVADLAHFVDAGGELPATAEQVALYLSSFADQLAVSTLTRRLATLSKIHKANGWPNPCDTELVRSAMRGVSYLD
ncbi:MAG: hypothetical protein P8P56_11820 [Yoonia sp.]|nr:hypothetical protein [Yoonia sp.]